MRPYKGVFIYGSKGNWTCDLLPGVPFVTLAKVKYFIDTHKSSLPDAGNNQNLGEYSE